MSVVVVVVVLDFLSFFAVWENFPYLSSHLDSPSKFISGDYEARQCVKFHMCHKKRQVPGRVLLLLLSYCVRLFVLIDDVQSKKSQKEGGNFQSPARCPRKVVHDSLWREKENKTRYIFHVRQIGGRWKWRRRKVMCIGDNRHRHIFAMII